MYTKVIGALNKITEYLTMGFLSLMVIIIFMQIISRELLGNSFPWVEEAARYLMVWTAFLAAGFTYQYAAHMSIDVIAKRLAGMADRVIRTVVFLLCLAFLWILFSKGMDLVNSSAGIRSTALELPMSLVYAALPISAVLQALNLFDLYFFKKEPVKTAEVME